MHDRDGRRRVREAKFPRVKRLADLDLTTLPPATLAMLAGGAGLDTGQPVVLLDDLRHRLDPPADRVGRRHRRRRPSGPLHQHRNIVHRLGDAVRATDLAAAAQHDHDGVDRKIRALACQQEARGWASARGYDHCAPKLQQAADLLATGEDEADAGAPTYIHHYGPEILEEQAATCYRDVGRADQAIAIFQQKIDALADYDRDRGYRMAKLAVAYAQAHQVHAAADLGLQALPLAAQTGSARTRNELQPLTADLVPWSNQPDVANLLDALRTHAEQR